MKNFIFGIVGLLVVLVLAIMITPMVYDVDTKLRPEIEKVAAESINGSLKIGKMKLNLWTGVKVEIDGIDLKASGAQKSVVSAKKAVLNIPFASLLSGQLKVDLALNNPEIGITKYKNAKFNFETLIKASNQKSHSTTEKANSESGSQGDLSVLNKVDLNINITDANLSYVDQISGLNTSVTGFNLELDNVGLGKDISLNINTKLDLSPNKDIKTSGRLLVNGTTRVDWGKETYSAITTDLKVDLSKLNAKVKGLVNKKAGVPLAVELKAKLYPNSAQIEQFDFTVNDLTLSTLGELKSINPLSFNFEVTSSMMDLADWRKIVVPLGQYGIAGNLSLGLKVNGTDKKLNYSGNLNINDGGLNVPGIKNPVTALRTNITINNENLDIRELSLLVGSSSLSMNGNLKSFSAPAINLGIYSANLSASDFITPLTNEEKQAKIEAAKADQPELTEEQIQKMVMGPIEQLKQIPILRKLRLNANIKVDKLYYEAVEARNFQSDIEYKNFALRLNKTRLDAFGGKVALVTAFDIRGSKPKYNLKTKVAALDTVAFTKAFMPELAGTITGRMAADFNLSGQGASKADLKQYLTGKGGFKLVDGTWSGLQALQLVQKKLEKVPQAKKEVGKVRIGNNFDSFQGKFNIKSGKFNLTSFIMDFREAKSAVIGKGYVDFDLNANLVASILAPLNNVPKKIRYRDGRAELPIPITGKITSPNIGWDKMLRTVAGAYAETAVKKEVKKKVDQEVQKLLKSKKAKDLMKKLGF